MHFDFEPNFQNSVFALNSIRLDQRTFTAPVHSTGGITQQQAFSAGLGFCILYAISLSTDFHDLVHRSLNIGRSRLLANLEA